MRILLAGASGVIGVRLVPLLIEAGHQVLGMTRTAAKADMLRELGATPAVCDVYDADQLAAVATEFAPDVVLHQVTDLPDSAAEIGAYGQRNSRIRTEGTANLLAAAQAAGGARVIAQSISWELPPERSGGTAEFERSVLAAGGVVIRYGQFYGPGTYFPDGPPPAPRIHVDDAARGTLPVLDAPPGLTIVIDDRGLPPAAH